jgi:hypothetical protein
MTQEWHPGVGRPRPVLGAGGITRGNPTITGNLAPTWAAGAGAEVLMFVASLTMAQIAPESYGIHTIIPYTQPHRGGRATEECIPKGLPQVITRGAMPCRSEGIG